MGTDRGNSRRCSDSAMKTEYVTISEDAPESEAMQRAGRIIRRGGLVAFPTETVYGLGADALNEEAAAKIYAAKGRPSDNPLIVHIADMDDLYRIAADVPETALRLADAFWPGPLTMIFNKKEIVPDTTTGGLSTVAVRFPSNRIAAALIRESGGFIAAPSANRSGRPSPTTAEHCRQDLDGRVDMIIDGGQVGIGLESTIIDVSRERPELLRPGFVTTRMLEDVVSRIDRDPSLDRTSVPDPAENTPGPRAPGMKYRHYAPKGEMILVDGSVANRERYIRESLAAAGREGKRTAVICPDEDAERFEADMVFTCGKRGDSLSAARMLFSLLRACDDRGADVIFAEAVSLDGIGDAVMNRMRKAAGYRIINADEML